MRYKLSRQIFTEEMAKIVSREMRKQKLSFPRATKKNLRELVFVSELIEESGLPSTLICKKLPGNLGHGIFLHPDAEPIKKGCVIAAYAGELSIVPGSDPGDGSYAFTPVENMHLTKEEQLYFDKKRRFHPKRFYSLKVDALKKGNFTRFINHSGKPNVVAWIVSISAKTPVEILYFAKKTIQPGEQLLVSYEDGGKHYWSAAKVKPFPMTPRTFQV